MTFGSMNRQGVYFVPRTKENARYNVVEEKDVPSHRHILRDEQIESRGVENLSEAEEFTITNTAFPSLRHSLRGGRILNV